MKVKEIVLAIHKLNDERGERQHMHEARMDLIRDKIELIQYQCEHKVVKHIDGSNGEWNECEICGKII